jgi:hypothetical protein
LAALNGFNQRIYQQLSLARPDGPPEYIITRTRLRTPIYDGAIDPVLAQLGVGTVEQWKAGGNEGLVVLRSTVMDPFLGAPPPAPDHITGLIEALKRAAEAALKGGA